MISQLAHEAQIDINNRKRQQYAVIVAVDLHGGFSKDGAIPWNEPHDLQWFKTITSGHICVMGRTTYDSINSKMGERGEVSVLPGRRCFVVTSTPLPRNNATVVSSLSEVDKYVSFEDIDNGITTFFIGGEKIYSEGIAKANTAYVTVVNAEVDADLFFPTKYLQKHFRLVSAKRHPEAPNLRFTTWQR